MYIDFKESSWHRVNIKPEKEEETIKMLKENKIECPSDLDNLGLSYYHENLTDTSDQLFPEDNDGCSTIEVFEFNKKGNPENVWSNEDKTVKSRSNLWQIITTLEETIDGTINLLENNIGNVLNGAILELLKNEQQSRQARENWR